MTVVGADVTGAPVLGLEVGAEVGVSLVGTLVGATVAGV